MFTKEEIDQIRKEAKAEAKKILTERLLGQLDAKVDEAAEEVAPITSDSWMITKPCDEEDFREVNMYGIALRVNRSGTAVQIFHDGAWHDRKIQKDKNGVKADWVIIPNSLCSQSTAKAGLVSVKVGRLVLGAFTEMPQYIQDVLYTKRGPSILFGLYLVTYKDGKGDSSLDNVAWIEEKAFNTAVKVKLSRMPHLVSE